MLKNLKIRSIETDAICAMIAQLNGEDLSKGEYFEQYTTGVYRHDGYIFNFNSFIKNNTDNKIIDEGVDYGVCNNYQQVLDEYKDLLENTSKNYVIGLSTVKPQNKYLYDDTQIDKVYCYHICEIE
jgi:hypothetical protein